MDAGISAEGRARAALRGLATQLAGSLPCVLGIDDPLVIVTDDADGMAVVKADQVGRI